MCPVSSFLNPVGPEQPGTYWKRRAAAVGALVVVLIVVWLLLGWLFGGSSEVADDAPGVQPTTATTAVSPDPSASADPGASASASASPAASASAARCANDVVSVEVTTKSATTSVGAGMGLTMSVTNTGDVACVRDVGAGANEIVVTSGSVLVWSSDFCNPSDATDLQILVPGTAWSTSITWPGTVVTKSCPANPPTAQPGTYKAQAHNGKVDSSQVSFVVQ